MEICCNVAYICFVFYDIGLLGRSLVAMFPNIAVLVFFLFVFLFGFALSIFMGIGPHSWLIYYSSLWTTTSTLFYATFGEIDYQDLVNTNTQVNSIYTCPVVQQQII